MKGEVEMRRGGGGGRGKMGTRGRKGVKERQTYKGGVMCGG